jgi:hypothetical protein
MPEHPDERGETLGEEPRGEEVCVCLEQEALVAIPMMRERSRPSVRPLGYRGARMGMRGSKYRAVFQ